MKIDISDEAAEAVRAAVAAGEYGSVDAAVDEALRRWGADRTERAALGRIWDDGKASGIAGPADFDALLGEARAELDSTTRIHRA